MKHHYTCAFDTVEITKDVFLEAQYLLWLAATTQRLTVVTIVSIISTKRVLQWFPFKLNAAVNMRRLQGRILQADCAHLFSGRSS